MINALNKLKEKYSVIFFISTLLLLLGCFLVQQINFMQNDDWVYYENVSYFLKGQPILHPTTASTFYLQGIIGATFAGIFGLNSLPFLTYIITVANFMLFSILLVRFHAKSQSTAVILSLLLFINPLHIYLGIGFMIDNYLLFFTLLSYYLFLSYREHNSRYTFILLLTLLSVVFYIKQSAITLPAAYAVYGLLNKDKKLFVSGTLISLVNILTYFFIIPHTPEQIEKQIDLSHITNFNELNSFIIQILVYLSGFVASLQIINLFSLIKRIKKPAALVILVILTVLAIIYINNLLQAFNFPSLPNTLGSEGFFIGGLDGNKYHFMGYFKFWYWWKMTGIILSGLLVFYIPTLFKKNLNFNFPHIFIIVYICSLWIMPGFYDRYLLLLLPFLIILLSENIKITYAKKIFIGLQVLLFGFISILYTTDYIEWNKYVWTRAEMLHTDTSTPRSEILATFAWNRKYNVCYTKQECSRTNTKYRFTFDKPDSSSTDYESVEVYRGKTRLFVDPNVYLYKKK